MFVWIKKLLAHQHRWETTHTNKWMIATRQECKCGLSRQASGKAAPAMFQYCWVYSDGTISRPYPHGEGMQDNSI